MNEIYGLSPALDVSARELGLLLRLFGFHHGRFIARFPVRWIRALFDSRNNISDLERKRVTTLLKAQGATFIDLGEPYDGNKSWLQNATLLLERAVVDGLITATATARERCYSVDDFADGVAPDSAGTRVLATAMNLVELLRPLLLTGSEVILVDRYLNLYKDKYQGFLRELSTSSLSINKTYRIFSSAEHFLVKEPLQSQSSRCFPDQLADGCKFYFYASDDIADMHSRYAFNVHGGVKYDKGFATEPSTKVDIEAMSETAHKAYFGLYSALIHATQPAWCV